MKKQRGISLSGMIFVLFVLFFVAILGTHSQPDWTARQRQLRKFG